MWTEAWWLINKSHLFTARLSKLLLGGVIITVVPFGGQPQSRRKVEEERKQAFVEGGFPCYCNILYNKLRLHSVHYNCEMWSSRY